MSGEGARYRFEMGRVIGEGSFGVVYRARMHLPGGIAKPVAIKVLHENLDPGTRARERLVSEARILGRLSDPGIVAVNELTQLASRQALVMEYVPGRDLRDCFLTDPPIPVRATLEVVAKVASTLHNAWSRPGEGGQPLHLVHRDIKPENIRVTEAGDVKLLDFGIAKPASARTWSSEQEALGTLLYMAPELFRGGEGAKQQTPARDVFGLGCILYESAAGKALFEGLEVSDVMRLGMDRPRFDAHLDARLGELHAMPGDLAALLRVMLAWDPKLRPEPIRVADVAYTLLDLVSGPRLFQWCRSVAWSEPVGTPGDLTGKVLEPQDTTSMLHATGAHAAIPAPAGLEPLAAPMAAEPPGVTRPLTAPAQDLDESEPASTPVPIPAPVPAPPPASAPAPAPARAARASRRPEPLLLAGAGLLVLGLGALLLAVGLAPEEESAPVVVADPGPAPVRAELPPAAAWPAWAVGDCALDAAFADCEPAAAGLRVLPGATSLVCPVDAGDAWGGRFVEGTEAGTAAVVALASVGECPASEACPTSAPGAAAARGAEPAAAAAPTGSVRLTAAKACVAVEVRVGDKRIALRGGSAAVPAGPIEIHARFEGRTWEQQFATRVRPGGQVVVECSCVSQLCSSR